VDSFADLWDSRLVGLKASCEVDYWDDSMEVRWVFSPMVEWWVVEMVALMVSNLDVELAVQKVVVMVEHSVDWKVYCKGVEMAEAMDIEWVGKKVGGTD
jgi:hypothetical protein